MLSNEFIRKIEKYVVARDRNEYFAKETPEDFKKVYREVKEAERRGACIW